MSALVTPVIRVELDDRDRQLAGLRLASLACRRDPMVGEIVAGTGEPGDRRRIAYVWDAVPLSDGAWEIDVQFEDCRGSYYLGDFGCQFSGSLAPTERIKVAPAGEAALASAWIFHHDHPGEGRGVDFLGRFRVWTVIP